jgi:hypothetical protein
VPVGSVRSRLDWASPTVAPPMSDTANTTMPISRQVAALDRKNSRPHAEAPQLPPRLNLLDPRLRQRDARTAVPSIDMSLIEIRSAAAFCRTVVVLSLKIRSARRRQEPIRLRAVRDCGAVRYRSTTGQAFRATSGVDHQRNHKHAGV